MMEISKQGQDRSAIELFSFFIGLISGGHNNETSRLWKFHLRFRSKLDINSFFETYKNTF